MENSIEGVMGVTLDRIKEMVDVNTVIGSPINTSQDCTIIPVSRVGFGFGVGGGEYDGSRGRKEGDYPFAGGSGAGVSITPIGFLVVKKEGVSMLPATSDSPIDRIVEMMPNLISSVKCAVKGEGKDNKENNEESENNGGCHCKSSGTNGTIHY